MSHRAAVRSTAVQRLSTVWSWFTVALFAAVALTASVAMANAATTAPSSLATGSIVLMFPILGGFTYAVIRSYELVKKNSISSQS